MSEGGGGGGGGGRKIKGGPVVADSVAIPDEPVNPQHYYYGTFQGVANFSQLVHPLPPVSQPVIGFPQLDPPPADSILPTHYYDTSYQTVPGYSIIEHRLIREARLPCCGMGIGWLLFIIGFLLGAVPWYIGAFLLLCVRMDYREKPGLIACTLGAVLSLIAITLGVTTAAHSW